MTATVLQGSFGKIALEPLVRFLAENGLDGILDLRTATGENGALEVSRGRVTAAAWGAATGEPAVAAIVAAAPSEFRFRAAPTRPADISGEIGPLFARAHAFAAALRAGGAPQAVSAPPDAPTTMVTVPSDDPRVAEASSRGIRVARPKPPVPQRARVLGGVWRVGDLVALANALIAEYAEGDYGGIAWTRDLTPRIRRVDALRRLDPPLPVVGGRIDATTLIRLDHPVDVLVPYLRAVVREVYREADRACGGSAARRGYQSAVRKLWGAGDDLWTEATRMVDTEDELRGRLTITGGLPPRTVELVERDLTLGRATTNDIPLKHQTVSRRHATITPRAGRYVLRDLASTSGTLLNGRPITEPRDLSTGDVIELGAVQMRFEQTS